MRISPVIALGIILALSTPANPAISFCLTAKQARELFPRIHLWWYRDRETGEKCWSNRRRGPPRNLKFDPVFSKAHAEDTNEKRPSPKSPVIKIVKSDEYNEIDAQADADTFFNAQPIPYWRFSALDDGFNTWRRNIWEPK